MKGIVSAGDKRTAHAGCRILNLGGNAYDAATACLFTAHVSEPALTSPAGGGFLLSYNKNKQADCYDFFVDVPPERVGKEKDFYPIDVDFGSTTQTFHIGHAAIAIPGVMKGILQIQREKGVLPLSEILKPAIALAESGVYLTKFQAYVLKILAPIFMKYESARNIYAPNDEIITHTSKLFNPDYANFLRVLSVTGEKIFYNGEIADRIDNISKNNNGLIRKTDLINYKVNKLEPIRFQFGEYTVITSPPPSMGGLLINFTLNLLNDNINNTEWGSKQHLFQIIEAMKSTQQFRNKSFREHINNNNIGYSQFDEHTIRKYSESYSANISPFGNTTHISIIDAEQNVVTCTTSNGEGSGIIIPDTGIMMNNMLGEEDLNPDGFFKWQEYVRLPSMMTPTIILKNSKPHLILGSSGSNRIRSAIIQTILNHLVFGKDIESAVLCPRLHMENNVVYLEPGFDKKVIEMIENHYPVVNFETKNLFFGGVQAVTGDMTGCADIRREGWIETV